MNRKFKFTKDTLGIILVLLLSTLLNFMNLSLEGYSNPFYAAAVKSMSMNLKNFFFVSFDPASFVTIDKPPLGFWIQTISAKIFGFSGFSILLPEALAGVISVAVIYHIVKRSFGSTAGIISALCLAVTPIFVAVSRSNTCDNLLVLTLLLSCWAISIAAEKGKLKYLLISLAIVGIGFNIKMLQAYMVIPSIYITYLLSSAVTMKKRIIHLLLGTVVLLIVSFSWAVAVDLVPASSRPYVDSSTNNSELELIVGWNGLNRLGLGGTSGSAFGGASRGGNGKGMQGRFPEGMKLPEGMELPAGMRNAAAGGGNRGTGGGAGGAGGMMGGSEGVGVTRLFSNNSLSDQIIWLFPLALFGLAAAVIKEKFKNPFNNDKRKLSLILWSMWLLPVFIYFSFTSGMFHPYYLTMLAPPIAALAGIGIVSMWDLYTEGSWKSWLLPVAFISDAIVQLLILSYSFNTSIIIKILMTSVSILCFGSSIILIFMILKKNCSTKLRRTLFITTLIGVLITPLVWSGTTMFYAVNGSMPSAGLELATSKNKGSSFGMDSSSSNTKLIAFLKANNTNEKYFLTVSTSSGTASDIIIKTGESVMSLGGFLGSDKTITLDQFKELASKGEVRYVMTGGMMGGGMSGSPASDVKEEGTATSQSVDASKKVTSDISNPSSEIMTWVAKVGTVVPESEWKDSTSNNQQQGGFGGGNSGQLYDLKGADTSK